MLLFVANIVLTQTTLVIQAGSVCACVCVCVCLCVQKYLLN